MKRTSLFISLLLLLAFVFALTACSQPLCQHRDIDDNSLCDKCGDDYTDGKDVEEPNKPYEPNTPESLKGTALKSTAMTLDGTNLSVVFPNATETFSFLEDIKISQGASYVVARDEYCENVIHTKVAPLTEGDNTFYILVTNGDDMELYTVAIRRRPMYTVSFNTEGGDIVPSQTVEEGYTATAPAPAERPGYTFLEWDFDFATPITSDITISAKWNASSAMDIKLCTQAGASDSEDERELILV